MKKILLIILLAVGAFINTNAQITITKSGPASVHVGEIFEYTVNISGITNLSQLGRIEDQLDPNLTCISSDFASTGSSVFSFYSFWCPTSLNTTLTAVPTLPVTGGLLVFTFPPSPACSGTGSGSLSFKIKVSVGLGACNVSSISNSVKLFDQSNSMLYQSSPCNVLIDNSKPWTLKKTFRSFTGGYLIYDVRLSSSVEQYNLPVLLNTVFTDDFTTDPCIGADISLSKVDYIPDEANLTLVTPMSGATSGGPNIFHFSWSLPNPTLPTLSSYLFQVKIKVAGCSCIGTPFNLLNHVDFAATDICGLPVHLIDDFNLMNARCLNNTLVPADEAKLCVKKEVHLLDNALNLTMSTCRGEYIITINNCTNTFNYTSINLTDLLPPADHLEINTINAGPITVLPSGYSGGITLTGTILTFATSISLAPGGIITITIPFIVTTPLPNEPINNCADISVLLDDGVAPASTIAEHFCDIGIRTVPNNVAIVTNKQICTTPVHSCGGYTINTNLPGDIVEYALHVYNYGTGLGTNFIVTDNLPANFNILDPANDIKVYKKEHWGSVITDECDISAFTEIISPFISKTYISNTLTVNFLANELDQFTCAGITHYIIKIRTQIAANVPNGSYPNVFQTQYTEYINGLGVIKSEVSNVVTSIVDRDQLVFTKKTATASSDCVNKRDTIKYEIWAINMGTQPIAVNINDVIPVPSPLSIATGITVIESETTNSSGTIIVNPLISSGPMSVAYTATTLDINNYEIAPCTLVKFRYSVVFNTNNLSIGQSVKVCNNAVITVGYLEGGKNPDFKSLPDITVSNNPWLINKFFDAKTDLDKFKVLEKIKLANKTGNNKMVRVKKSISGTATVFVPINTITLQACINISDCLDGSGTGCFTSTGAGNFTFAVNSIDNSGKASTTLTIPAAAPKVRKVEYILADTRILVDACADPNYCYNCNQSLVGNFYTSTSLIGSLPSISIPLPAVGYYKEKNKVEFSDPSYSNITGSYNIDFQLPVSSLNCNGNLEVVLTAIVYFEDCSVCYVSVAYDYNAIYTWKIPVIKKLNSKGTRIKGTDTTGPKKNK